MIFKKRKIQKIISLHKDEIADLEDEYREKLKLLKIEADNHLDKEITKYKEKLAKEQNQKADAEKQKLQTKHDKEIKHLINEYEKQKILELEKLEKKFRDSDVFTKKLQKYFSDELGREYQDVSFKELEEDLKNDLKEIVYEINDLNKQVDDSKDKLLQFNELAKEINYLEEEIGIKRNELYEIKQAIKELKKEGN